MKKTSFIIIILIILAGAVYFITASDKKIDLPEGSQLDATAVDWRSASFTNVVTGEQFSINDFKGKTVLLESFAVWCPTCLKQQKELKKLQAEDDEIIHISLDTDPNESAERVREHIEQNNFDWNFAVSPIEVTKDLIDEFGLRFVNAPAAPVVLICPDQTTHFLGRGVKTAAEIQSDIKTNCRG